MSSKGTIFSLDRRRFIKNTAIGLASIPVFGPQLFGGGKGTVTDVVLIRTDDRSKGVQEALKALNFVSPKGKKVFIKPNFNTADPTPGSTHNDTLAQLVEEIRKRGAAGITVGDRSGPADTQKVLEDKGIVKLAEKFNFELVNFTKLEEKDWLFFKPNGSHWESGFYMARPVIETQYPVSTYCLKTHQYGGVFTLALKLTVGSAPRRQMRELHRSPNMRKMIAELNHKYRPHLLVMDGVEAFVDGGPMTGTKKQGNVILAGTDPVAMDAVGVAILKEMGSNDAIMGTKIYEQEQIKRAVELGLGVGKPEQINFITIDKAGKSYADKIRSILLKG